MKRYFSLSFTLFAFSVLNILTYFLLGAVMRDSAYSGLFSITYPLQFVVSTLVCIFATASNIRANKENNKNCVGTGMVLGLICGAAIFGVVAIFVDEYLKFMSMDPAVFRTFTLMVVGDLFLSYVCYLVTEKLYYENKDRRANIYSLVFIFVNMLTIVVTAMITKKQLVIVLVNLISLFVYVTVLFVVHLGKFKFDFSLVKNFKYESMNIVDCLFLFIIYLFGFSVAFGFGEEYFVAINFTTLITDPIWDAVEVKIAKIDISQSCYNYKSAIKNSGVVTLVYVLIAFVLFFSLFKFYDVVLWIGLIYLVIQLVDMLMYVVVSNLQTFLQLEYSPTKVTIINLVIDCVRTLLTVILITPYNTDIAQISVGFLSLIIFLILRYKNFKLDKNGFLIKKEKKKEPQK